MGVYSEMDLDMQYGSDNPFAEDNHFSDEERTAETGAVQQSSILTMKSATDSATQPQPVKRAEQDSPAPTETADATEEDEDAKRKAHEESEAKRKAEWEAKQQAKKAAEQEQLDRLAAMSDDEVMMASTQRIGADTVRLTRRNMKECVSEHIQTLCLDDPAFARKTMHPRKSMIHCIWYINRKAKEFAEREMKDNGFKPENGVYGCDIPDDLCYQWAEDYINQ